MPVLLMPLALIGLASLPTLAAIYYLRNRFRRRAVSSLMLWSDQQRAREGGARLQRLHTPLMFFLELLVLAMLVLAAAGPRILRTDGASALVVVLDDSYSMLAGVQSSARDRGREVIESVLGDESKLNVRFIAAGDQPQLMGDVCESVARASEVLEQWACYSSGSDLHKAVALAAELAGPGGRIMVVSDREAPAELLTDRVVWHAVGEAAGNQAIVWAVRQTQGEAQRCLIEVANASALSASTTLSITAEGGIEPLVTKGLNLGAGQSQRLVVDLPVDTGAITIGISDDALAVDNVVRLEPGEVRKLRVSVNLSDRATSEAVSRAVLATGRAELVGGEADLLVSDQPMAQRGDAWGVRLYAGGEVRAYVGPFVIDQRHALVQGLSLSSAIWSAGERELAGEPIISAGNLALLSVERLGDRARRIHLNLEPELSSLGRSANWPVLWWNIVGSCIEALPGPVQANYRLGESVAIDLAGVPQRAAVLIDPSGARSEVAAIDRRIQIDARRPGLWQVSAGEEAYRFSVNTMNRSESDLSALTSGQSGRWVESAELREQYVSVSWVMVLVALGAMMVHLGLVHLSGQSDREGGV